ncbi:hypothetical protein [uncultured Sphingomonas sp.]|uniref:hypothetical protein n=1 Tax=uncultured Sphingomonas sp. TaxID=158754 RepID=UPI0035CC149C
MTGRDLRWRVGGAVLFVAGCAAPVIGIAGPLVTLPCFAAALVGIVLMLNGKRVPVLLKAERRGHCDTAAVIHSRRTRQSRRPTGPARR